MITSTEDLIRSLLDSIWNSGHTPRIYVDAKFKGVVLPEHVVARFPKNVPIDLLASYPLNLDYGTTGLSMDLAFSGSTARCSFPWRSIVALVDQDTGKGVDLTQEAVRKLDGDKSVDAELEEKIAPSGSPEDRRAKFKVIKGDKK